MTAAVLEHGHQARPLPVPIALGLQEGRRILLHPVSLAGYALMAIALLGEGVGGPRGAFELISSGPTWFCGVFTYFAAHLVASRDRRAHSGELLEAAPTPATGRVAALCAAALVPMLASAAAVAVGHAMLAAAGQYGPEPTFWHLAQGPLTVLGAALLGIMVARLTSVPGAALLVMIAMILGDAWLSTRPDDLQPLATYVSWAYWGPGTHWWGHEPGSVLWHDVYLLGLCAMAACGAFLREARRPWRVLAAGALLTALTAIPAVLQLP